MIEYFIIGLMAFTPTNVTTTPGYESDNYQYNLRFETYNDGMSTYNTYDYDDKQNAQVKYNVHYTWRLNYKDKYNYDVYIENLVVDYFTVDRTILDQTRELTYSFTLDRQYFIDYDCYKIPHNTDVYWSIYCVINQSAGWDYYWNFHIMFNEDTKLSYVYQWSNNFYPDYPDIYDRTTYLKNRITYNLFDRYYDFILNSDSLYYDGYDDGRADGYASGFVDGRNEALETNNTVTTIFNGILNVALVPINFFLGIFNFEILGINIASLVSGILTLCCVIIVIRLFMGGGSKSD